MARKPSHKNPKATANDELYPLVLRAWAGLVIVPIAYIAATLAGVGLTIAFGFNDAPAPPAWFQVFASLVTFIVMLTPAAFSLSYARQLGTKGSRQGLFPVIVCLLVAVAYLVLHLMPVFG